MGKGTNNGNTGRLYITTTPELREFLDGLALLGIHGGSAAEVARRFVESEVERTIREGIVEKTMATRRLIRGGGGRARKAKGQEGR